VVKRAFNQIYMCHSYALWAGEKQPVFCVKLIYAIVVWGKQQLICLYAQAAATSMANQ